MKGSGEYRTIKSLVFDFVRRCRGKVDYDALSSQVRKHFPRSKWKRTHWSWYRYQMVRGRFRGMLSEEVKRELSGGRPPPDSPGVPIQAEPAGPALQRRRGPEPRDAEIKRLGDAILAHVRFVISLGADSDDDKRFKLNRWVFSRLLQDEIRVKRPIKQRLWDDGMTTCQACGQAFDSLRGVELHRKDPSRGYSCENCELLCRECHQELA